MIVNDRFPAFESLPSAVDIMHWFIDEKRREQNEGGDAWWLCNNPHGSLRWLAHVDYDTQEFWLLEVATGDTKDLLFVMAGLDGRGCDWWQHPIPETANDLYWHRDGIEWLADQIVVHEEAIAAKYERDRASAPDRVQDTAKCSDCGTVRPLTDFGQVFDQGQRFLCHPSGSIGPTCYSAFVARPDRVQETPQP